MLSLLTLFLLIGTAFIVSSDHYRRTLKTFAEATEASNSSIDQVNLLNEVINQIVRDTNNQNSSLRFHSLLRDMYGNDGLMAEIAINSTAWAGGGVNGGVTGGQMLQFSLNNVTDQFGVPYINSTATIKQLSQINNAYNGLVLTFLDGPARGQSTRITSYVPEVVGGAPAIFRVMSPRKADGSNIVAADFANLNTSRILINGRPFNGTGAGYNPFALANAAKLNTRELVSGTNREVSLLPNAAFFNHLQVDTNGPSTIPFFSNQWTNLNAQEQQRLIDGMGLVGQGGSDESYDAVDFQNMVLALLPTNPQETVLFDVANADPNNLGSMVIPSLHRPALLNYWRQLLIAGGGALESDPNLLRKVLLRPNWLDHPNFTGSNPDFANLGNHQDRLRRMIYGPWDVDNDNSGIRDSMWVDVGLPVMENADGRLVKPLAAILVLDMGGRLNLNVHGSEGIANAVDFNIFNGVLAGNNDTNNLPQGQGYGPAEISLGPLMPYNPNPAGARSLKEQRWKWYKRIFRGADRGHSIVPDITQIIDFQTATPTPRVEFMRRQAGKLGLDNGITFVPGQLGFDIAAQLKMQGVPLRANDQATRFEVLGNYATPPDFKGRYAMPGLNDLGQPVYEAFDDLPQGTDTAAQAAARLLNAETPYELDLSLGAARGDSLNAPDGPYTMAELERILRSYDPDAGALPSRIWGIVGEFKRTATATTPDLATLNLWRTTVTTESFDPPVPSVVVPGWMRSGLPNGSGGFIPGTRFESVMARPPVGLIFADLLEYRIRVTQSPPWQRADDNLPANSTRLPLIRQAMRKLLPPDLADGLRLDVNRPFGNGRDDNDNGVVDEPGEWDDADGNRTYDGELEASYWTSSDARLDNFTGNNGSNYGKFRDERILFDDRNNDGLQNTTDRDLVVGADGVANTHDELIAVHNLRRQMLARDLYVMAMTLADPFELTTKEGKAKARMLAQWAINVVDFRDPDNIMTAFEYDVNPFDGWAVDGNTSDVDDWKGVDTKINTNDDLGGVVWGAESPEMLMTETLAWHDRRTENHADEDPDNDEDGDGAVNHKDRGTVPKSASPSSGTDIPDSDFDQRFLPVGAGFIELYCPLPPNPAANADTHAIDNLTGDDLGIDMAAVDEVTFNSPCWRLMIYKTNFDGNAGPGRDPDSLEFADIPKLADRCVYFTDFDPESPATGTPRAKGWDDDGVAYYSTLNTPTVMPGRFMVVGGGDGTNQYKASLGSDINQTKFSNIGITLDASANSAAAIVLNGTATFTVPSDVATVALIDRPRRFTFSEPAKGYPVRIKGSTMQDGPPNSGKIYTPILDIPLDDQRMRTGAGKGLVGGGGGGGGGLGARAKGGKMAFQDNELRLMLPPPRAGGGGVAGGGGGGGAGVGGPDPTKAGRTIPGFSWVYLQRLANPLLPWNPEPVAANGVTNLKHDDTLAVNPYMTIDAMGVSVTVFNGLVSEELSRNLTGKGNQIKRYKNVMSNQFFTSVERGQNNNPQQPAGDLSRLQTYVTNRPARAISRFLLNNAPASLASNLWNPESIGYTGKGIAGLSRNTVAQNINNNFRANPKCTLGFVNQSFGGSPTQQLEPTEPFPWYTWNNRPYANANELMLVPAFRSSQLLQAFSYRTTSNNKFSYDGKVTEIPLSTSGETLVVDGPFGHLLNFFRTDSTGADGDLGTSDDQGIAGLHRLLDYVHVPSPFVKTETWLNPVSFGNAAVNNVDDPRYLRQPPFNRIAEYREPGRVNLNTVVSAEVWDGGVLHRELDKPALAWDPLNTNSTLRNNYLPLTGHAGPLFVDTKPGTATKPGENGLVESRRGYPGSPAPPPTLPPAPATDDMMLLLDARVPTFFASPFRSGDAGNLVPLPNLQRPSSECTVLRRQAFNPGFDGQWGGQPGIDEDGKNGIDDLGEFDATNDIEDEDPLFAGVTTTPYNNSARNPYFSFQPMTRLSSMTTTRSNVYAVWVTIGFFEVEKAPDMLTTFKNLNDPTNALSPQQLQNLYDKVYPGGYMLGKEAGSDTGDLRRVREFAMIDRTVPVAFEPGQNHNVDKAIRLRRRIE